MRTVRHMEVHVGSLSPEGRQSCTLTELRDGIAILEEQLGSDCAIRFQAVDHFGVIETPDGPRTNVAVIMGTAVVEVDRYGTPITSNDPEKA